MSAGGGAVRVRVRPVFTGAGGGKVQALGMEIGEEEVRRELANHFLAQNDPVLYQTDSSEQNLISRWNAILEESESLERLKIHPRSSRFFCQCRATSSYSDFAILTVE